MLATPLIDVLFNAIQYKICVLLVTATDPDEGRNGMILYELQHPRGSGVVPFKLDSNSGAIMVSGPLRRGRIAVFVEASDQVRQISIFFSLVFGS